MPLWPFTRKTKPSGGEFSSSGYWTERYKKGRNSGAGSYGRLADYKAGFINEFVVNNKIHSIVEFGSGDGNQASLFEFQNYLGVDVVPQVVQSCAQRFADRKSWAFSTLEEYDRSHDQRELGMSLDVVYHLIEESVFDEYMKRLFKSATRFVLVYSSDHEEVADAVHVRHRNFSEWVNQNAKDWRLVQKFENPHRIEIDNDPKNSSFAFFTLFERSQIDVEGTELFQ